MLNESLLETYLNNGKIAGAWLDVFCEEPYNGNLVNYKNVILTPHIGSYLLREERLWKQVQWKI